MTFDEQSEDASSVELDSIEDPQERSIRIEKDGQCIYLQIFVKKLNKYQAIQGTTFDDAAKLARTFAYKYGIGLPEQIRVKKLV